MTTPLQLGVDYAWQRPAVTALVAAGKTFACRYGGPGGTGKQLDAIEVAALTSHGISIVSNAEGVANAFVDAAAGVAWATQARDHFRALGMPVDRPIYFSCDFNAANGDLMRIDTALRAAAGVIGASNVGVYGDAQVIGHCATTRSAKWFWQTLAWSDGQWSPLNHIEQYRNAVTLPGSTAVIDLDRAMKQDFGQWGVKNMTNDVHWFEFQSNVPVIRQGYTDATFGARRIWRIQTILGLTADGAYGKITAAAVAAKMKTQNIYAPSSPDGSIFAEPEYRVVFAEYE